MKVHSLVEKVLTERIPMTQLFIESMSGTRYVNAYTCVNINPNWLFKTSVQHLSIIDEIYRQVYFWSTPLFTVGYSIPVKVETCLSKDGPKIKIISVNPVFEIPDFYYDHSAIHIYPSKDIVIGIATTTNEKNFEAFLGNLKFSMAIFNSIYHSMV